ncbi:MAG: toast rack family protein [bacterium]
MKQNKKLILQYCAGVLPLIMLLNITQALAQEVMKREVNRTTEKEVTATISASFLDLSIIKGSSKKIVEAEFWKDKTSRQRVDFKYHLDGTTGKLLIESRNRGTRSNENISWKDADHEKQSNKDNRWELKFTDDVPINFDIELGAGSGDLDLTGIKVNDLRVSAGASSSTMICTKPNEIECRDILIESGVSKFVAEDLLNLNFEKMKFKGGVGSYRLDFGGSLLRSAEADISVGLGTVTIYLSPDIPTRIIANDHWLSSVDIDDAFEKVRKNTYETPNFKKKDKTFTIKVEAGLGSVNVKSR